MKEPRKKQPRGWHELIVVIVKRFSWLRTMEYSQKESTVKKEKRKNGSFSGRSFCVEEIMSGNRIRGNIESDSLQSDPAEEEKDPSMQDPAAQRHPQRYPMAVCDQKERWVREYMEQTGEEPGFF